MSDATHFERLGLPRRFSLDLARLEREYLAQSRALHPDFHQAGSDADRRASEELSARLNDAYTTLKDSFRRAEYLLELAGGPQASAERALPESFLLEAMEAREELDARQAAGATAEELAPPLRQTVARIVAEAGAMLDAADPDSRAIRRTLNAANTYRGMLRDLHSPRG